MWGVKKVLRGLLSFRPLLLCTLLLLWSSSYAWEVGAGCIWYPSPGWYRSIRVVSSTGGITLFDWRSSSYSSEHQSGLFLVTREPADPTHYTVVPELGREALGFAYRYLDGPARPGEKLRERVRRLRVPYWPLAVVIVLWMTLGSRRPASTGVYCTTCGYDLRATPDRCPECGGRPAPASEAPHNPPMQRTGAADIVSFVRKLLGRGPGR